MIWQDTGVPCALSGRERAALRRWCRNRRVVEAGALLGGSTIEIARAATSLVSIDRHEGYSAPTYRQFRSNLDRARVTVRAVVGDAVVELPRFAADAAFIDLTGEYALTLAAIRATTAPLVLVHDLGRVRCRGVEQALLASHLHILEHIDTLAVCVRA